MSANNDTASGWGANGSLTTDSEEALLSMHRVLGRKWHPVVVHKLLDDPKGFNDLKTDIDDISSKVLSTTLQDLEEKGVVHRTIVSDKPVRVEYSLTEFGRSLRPLIETMGDRGRAYLSEPDGAALGDGS